MVPWVHPNLRREGLAELSSDSLFLWGVLSQHEASESSLAQVGDPKEDQFWLGLGLEPDPGTKFLGPPQNGGFPWLPTPPKKGPPNRTRSLQTSARELVRLGLA